MADHQWLFLARLCEREYSLQEAIEVMEKLYPATAGIRKIADCLNDGIPLKSILKATRLERKIGFYLDHLSLPMAIEVSRQEVLKEKGLLKKTAGSLGYQILLVVLSFILLVFFQQVMIPSIVSSLALPQEKTTAIMTVFRIISISEITGFLALGTVSFLLYLVVRRKKETYLWAWLHGKKKDRLIRMYVTSEFSRRLSSLLERGIRLPEAVGIIRSQQENRLTALLGYHLEDLLEKGENFQDSLKLEYFDDEFHPLCIMGLKTGDFDGALKDYMEMVEIRLQTIVKRTSVIMQGVCYGLVTVIIVLSYLVLLMPLELLEGI
ncbi:MAG: type II secretion system F family protein [Erysipelotrichaceae bacterium]|nr:type II secretion system F family protein [Erysipelotrichaceae bacterium]